MRLILEIKDDSSHRIFGQFRTALSDSAFFGQEIETTDVHYGDCIGLTAGGVVPAGDTIVTYTVVLREGKRETLRHAVTDAKLSSKVKGASPEIKKLNWWRSITTKAETFERVSE